MKKVMARFPAVTEALPAAGLHFGYYNFVRVHRSLRMTPAMAGGVTDHIWTVPELIEAAA
jgi:hypothetical protein